jgi:hypothetical protein
MTIGQRLYRSQVEAALTVGGVSAVLGLAILRTGTDASLGDRDRSGLDPGPHGYFCLSARELSVCAVTHG